LCLVPGGMLLSSAGGIVTTSARAGGVCIIMIQVPRQYCASKHSLYATWHATACICPMPMQTLDLPALGSECVCDAQPDVVATGVAVWRKRVMRLAELLRQGTVIAEVGW
jgi:hypothetical protein